MNKEFDDFTGMVDDIRKLAEVEYPIIMSPNGRTLAGGHYDIDVNYSERLAYIQGYNKAKETLYTEEQVIAIVHLWDNHINVNEEEKGSIKSIEKFVQSLKQPKP